MSDSLGVLETCRFVAERSENVRIDQEAVGRFCRELVTHSLASMRELPYSAQKQGACDDEWSRLDEDYFLRSHSFRYRRDHSSERVRQVTNSLVMP